MRKNGFTHTVAGGLGNKAGVEILKRRWDKQGGICALTGDQIIPGFNASLDHIVPRARGGLSIEENLQWVTLDANMLKRALTDDELVAVCRRIIEHRGSHNNVVGINSHKAVGG